MRLHLQEPIISDTIWITRLHATSYFGNNTSARLVVSNLPGIDKEIILAGILGHFEVFPSSSQLAGPPQHWQGSYFGQYFGVF